MKPVVDRLEQEFEGKVDFTVYMDEADEEGERIAAQLDIRYVPTFVYVNADGTIAKTDVGAVPEADMRAKIEALK